MFKTRAGFVLLASATAIFIILAGCTTKKSEAPAGAQPADQSQSTKPADARPARNPLKNAYFGDLHLHSGYSMDAFAFGTRTTPEDSYKYAMGETVDYMASRKSASPLSTSLPSLT